MKHIIILTDFSENSFHAALYAMNLFKKQKVSFNVLHVKDSRGMMTDDLMTGTFTEDVRSSMIGTSEKKLTEFLNRILTINTNLDHEFKADVLFGSFYDAIRNYGRKKDIDLLVMGTTGATGAKQVFLGSTAAKVINKVNIPILAIPKNVEFKDLEKILFSIDYKVDYLPVTMLPLLEVIDLFKPELKLIYANENESELTDNQKLNRQELERILTDYDYTSHCINGVKLDDVVSCLTDFVEIDMVVMIKKDRGVISKMFNSSHIRKVSYHTKKPLLVLPERPLLFD